MKENNVTYLLGAGASYNALPVVSNWQGRLLEFIKYLGKEKLSIIDNSHGTLNEVQIKQILDDISSFFPEAKEHSTIDTYAKKLFLKGGEEDTHFETMPFQLILIEL